jgi:uncharacterized DUF497 family protein
MKPRWDPQKAEENWRKHGVSFIEAGTIFLDHFIVVVFDDARSTEEDRYFAIGESIKPRLLAVAFTIRGGEPWIISARVPTRPETRRYMRGDELRDKGTADIDQDSDPTAHLDWKNAIRGRFYRPTRGPITVEIDDKLAMFFRNAEEVNAALRLLIVEGRVGPEEADGHRQFPYDHPRAR